MLVGRMFWEATFEGLTRFGAFHEHIGPAAWLKPEDIYSRGRLSLFQPA